MDWTGAAMRQARRELAGVALLASCAGVLFVGTRALARHERQVNRDDAARWHETATFEFNRGETDAAIAALRRAASLDRGNPAYSIALGRALADTGRFDDAMRVLGSLRAGSPGDPQINLALARVAAGRSDVDGAMHYYHSALYGTWPDEAAQDRTDLRIELIRLLLTSGRADAARAELAALDATAPRSLPNLLAVGSLLLEAGDDVHAFDAFRRAQALAPDDDRAAVGAGRAAFALGRYPDAYRLLERADPGDAALGRLREIAGHVTRANPLAPRLSPAERQRRLHQAMTAARDRIQRCLLEPGLPPDSRMRLGAALAAEQLGRSRPDPHEDAMTAIESGLARVRDLEEAAEGLCPADALNEALLVIARRAAEGGG